MLSSAKSKKRKREECNTRVTLKENLECLEKEPAEKKLKKSTECTRHITTCNDEEPISRENGKNQKFALIDRVDSDLKNHKTFAEYGEKHKNILEANSSVVCDKPKSKHDQETEHEIILFDGRESNSKQLKNKKHMLNKEIVDISDEEKESSKAKKRIKEDTKVIVADCGDPQSKKCKNLAKGKVTDVDEESQQIKRKTNIEPENIPTVNEEELKLKKSKKYKNTMANEEFGNKLIEMKNNREQGVVAHLIVRKEKHKPEKNVYQDVDNKNYRKFKKTKKNLELELETDSAVEEENSEKQIYMDLHTADSGNEVSSSTVMASKTKIRRKSTNASALVSVESGKENKSKSEKTLSEFVSNDNVQDVDDHMAPSLDKNATEEESSSEESVNFSVPKKSFPKVCKNNNYRKSRLKEFKNGKTVRYQLSKKICQDMKIQGKTFNIGRFNAEENAQLVKNWKKLTKNCPFDEPHILLMKTFEPEKKEAIKAFIEENNFYYRLGKHINRPLYSVYIRARKLFHPGNFKGRYSSEEVSTLKTLFYKYGSKWQKIGQMMERSGQSLNDKFKILKAGKSLGYWSKEEDEALTSAVKTFCDINSLSLDEAFFNLPWTEIACNVPTRVASQCRERWLSILASGKEGPHKFSKETKILLINELIAQNVSHESEIDWMALKQKFNAPSPQFLQNKWYQLKTRKPDFQNCRFRDVLGFLKTAMTPESIFHSEEKPLEETIPAWRLRFPQMAMAVDWLKDNRLLFHNTVLEPLVTNMSEMDIEALQALDASSTGPSYHVAEATSFQFENKDDIILFMHKVRDEQDLHVNCAMI